MAEHPVKVTFELVDGKYYVTAYPYPVPGGHGTVKNRDAVKWTTDATDEKGDPVELQVEFEYAYDLDDTSRRRRTRRRGPFEDLSHPDGKVYQVIGRLSDGEDRTDTRWRYLCIFLRNGQRIPWKSGTAGEYDGGGIDTHRPPPIP